MSKSTLTDAGKAFAISVIATLLLLLAIQFTWPESTSKPVHMGRFPGLAQMRHAESVLEIALGL